MINEAKEILGLIAVGSGLLWSGYKYGLKPVILKNKKAKSEWIGKITEIRDELKFNGGSSLKDAVYHVKNKVDKKSSHGGKVDFEPGWFFAGNKKFL